MVSSQQQFSLEGGKKMGRESKAISTPRREEKAERDGGGGWIKHEDFGIQ